MPDGAPGGDEATHVLPSSLDDAMPGTLAGARSSLPLSVSTSVGSKLVAPGLDTQGTGKLAGWGESKTPPAWWATAGRFVAHPTMGAVPSGVGAAGDAGAEGALEPLHAVASSTAEERMPTAFIAWLDQIVRA